MYPQAMNLRARVYRSPEAGEGGSLPASAAPQAAPESSPASAPEYLSKSDFDSFRSEITGYLQKLTPKQQAAQDAKDVKETGSKRPSPKDFDFDKDPEALQKYEDALDDWRDGQRREKAAKERTENEAKERSEKTAKGHQARVLEYKKENPSFEDDVKKAGPLQGEAEVTQAVFSHPNSAAIVHHIAQNKGVLDELNQLSLTDGREAVLFRVGEISAEIKAAKKALESTKAAAADVPPRQNFRGNSPSKDRELSLEERFARFNK